MSLGEGRRHNEQIINLFFKIKIIVESTVETQNVTSIQMILLNIRLKQKAVLR